MDFTSKLSLYDIIAMIIPGGTILLYLLINLGYKLTIDEFKINEALCWIIGVVASYILGIINHHFTKVLWCRHKNNTDVILCTLLETKNKHTIALNDLIGNEPRCSKNSEDIFCDQVKFSICLVVFFAIGVLIFTVVGKLPCWDACGTYIISMLLGILFIIILLYCVPKIKRENDEGLLDKYYEAYTYVQQRGQIKGIPIIEGQVAFLQGMLLPLLLLSTLDHNKLGFLINLSVCSCKCCQSHSCCPIRCGILLVCLLIFPVVFSRLNATYRIVWEYYEYVKRIESKEGK